MFRVGFRVLFFAFWGTNFFFRNREQRENLLVEQCGKVKHSQEALIIMSTHHGKNVS